MTPEMIELAKRAVACRGWRWMPGMRVEWVGMSTGWRMLSETQSWYEREEMQDGEPGGPNAIPDLTDPATLGCLLALVREVRGAPRALVRLSSNGKSFHVFDVDRVTVGGNWAAWLSDDRCPSEAHALVAALEGK